MDDVKLEALFISEADEITNALAEHLTALIYKARAHLVGMLNAGGPDEIGDPDAYRAYIAHSTELLSVLEQLTTHTNRFCLSSLILREGSLPKSQ